MSVYVSVFYGKMSCMLSTATDSDCINRRLSKTTSTKITTMNISDFYNNNDGDYYTFFFSFLFFLFFYYFFIFW